MAPESVLVGTHYHRRTHTPIFKEVQLMTVTTRCFSQHRVCRCVLFLLLAATVVLMSTATSLAVPLPPGTTLFPAPAGPLPGGVVVAGGVPVPFATATFVGTLTSTVLAGDPTNPFVGGGGLTYTYLLANVPGSPGAIDRLTVADFTPAPGFTDSDYVAGPGPGLPPTFIDRSVDGTTVGFSFLNPPIGPGALAPAMTSDLLVVYTADPVFAATLANVIDSNVARVASFAPKSVIPEPSTFVLAGLAALGLAVFARRRV
jgi:hypothetical protein